jgi:beta-lactamase class A
VRALQRALAASGVGLALTWNVAHAATVHAAAAAAPAAATALPVAPPAAPSAPQALPRSPTIPAGPAASTAAATADWPARLVTELARVDARFPGAIGVYVRDLDTGVEASYHAEETWYLASTVKIPIALTVLRTIERGEHTLDSTLTLRATDYVDGTGETNSHPPGTQLTLRYLIEQMIVYSDNTASDMLIDMVGINEVNALVRAIIPKGFQRITSLADVRRHAYSQIVPSAMQLSGSDFLLLKKQRTDSARLGILADLYQTPPKQFQVKTVGAAFEAYYATHLNSARLDAYGELLAKLMAGKILAPTSTAYLLDVMRRVQTGQHRIKAGLAPPAVFAHKTGTQRARTCDSGIITEPTTYPGKRIVIAACTRGDISVARSDRALKEVGQALRTSGLLTIEGFHDPTEDLIPVAVPRTGAARP